jgi:hypothetical protein
LSWLTGPHIARKREDQYSENDAAEKSLIKIQSKMEQSSSLYFSGDTEGQTQLRRFFHSSQTSIPLFFGEGSLAQNTAMLQC